MNINFNYTKAEKERPSITQRRLPIFGELEKNIIYTFSGKSAISLLLRFFRENGRLKDKSDQLLVPEWLGSWVYMTIHKFCFPTAAMNSKVKGILLYHQWGFPQRMEKVIDFCKAHNLFIIEDCAHSFLGFYNNKRLGTFGDASIFSLAKFFPSVLGGAVYSNNKDILNFVRKTLPEHKSNLAKQAFINRKLYDANPSEKNQLELGRDFAIYDRLLKCPSYSLDVVRAQINDSALLKRKNNFQLFKEAFRGHDYTDDLFIEDVIPWIAPLFLGDRMNKKLVNALRKNGIESGIYHFDINRNLTDPDFKECVAVPCHQGINMTKMIKIIKNGI